jgi:protein-disulfide isomerase
MRLRLAGDLPFSSRLSGGVSMFRCLLGACLFAVSATWAFAFDIEAMSDAERDAFRAEIRSYLVENPEVLMEAIAVLEARQAEAAAAEEDMLLDQYRAEIFDDGYSWVGGNPDGDVTIVEFLDYRCGFCKRAHPAVNTLLSSDGGIRFVVKEFPILGPESELASRYAISLKRLEGDEIYGAVHDALMEWNGAITEGALGRIASETGVADHEAVLAGMNSEDVSRVIASNRALGQALRIQGTPSFVMGENFVRGFVELDQMREIVRNIRAQQG